MAEFKFDEVKEVRPPDELKNSPLGKIFSEKPPTFEISDPDAPIDLDRFDADAADSNPNKMSLDETPDSGNNSDGGDNTENARDAGENDNVEKIHCRNEELEGKTHPETGIPFEKKTIEVDGVKKEGVFADFDEVSVFNTELPEDMYEASDNKQFGYCNEKLKEAIEQNPELAEQFTEEQLEQIMNGETPDGYTWHHDAEPGKMQLVPTEVHQKTGHTGGRVVWGGGSENR